MKLGLWFASIVAIASVLAFGSTTQQLSASQEIGVGVVPAAGAPVALTHCTAGLSIASTLMASADAINRSDVFLTSYVVRWSLYDHSGNLMGQADLSYSFDTDLAPNDTTSTGNYGIYNNTEPLSALSQVKCRLESAKFEGGLSWTYGRVWHRRLAPLPHSESSLQNEPQNVEKASGALGASTPNLAGVGVVVSSAWDDTVNGDLLIHVAMNLHAPSMDVIVRPANLDLTMKLANGQDHVFVAMADPAPTYQKLDPLGQSSTTQTAYKVDPKEDLGRLGSVKIGANSISHVVATFAVGDVKLADPHDNRRVSLK